MRSLLAVLLLVALAACSGPARDRHEPAGAVATTAPTALTCDGDSLTVNLDYGGDRTFTELLATWSSTHGRPWVDRARHSIWFLRPDGTAHTVLTFTHSKPRGGRAWWVGGYQECNDASQWKHLRAAPTAVELEVGHCWIDPVTVLGKTWDVMREDQFGWGGPAPRGFTSHGAVSAAGDVAVYTDASGTRLTLVPQDDPWALRRGLCD